MTDNIKLKNMPRSQIIPDCKVIRNIPIDWKLLKKLLYYRTYSQEKEIAEEFRSFLIKYIDNIPNTLIEHDTKGNMYITKGESDIYPCVVAHQDINQAEIPNVLIMQTSKLMFGIDKETGLQCGLGFDDKAGIYLALHCLNKYDNIKVFLAVDEEVGGLGSHVADPMFFVDCSFLLQGDRNSWENDVSYYTNGEVVVTADFMEKSYPVLGKYGYDYANCLYTDIGILGPDNDICAINISIGYFDEHWDTERLSIPHFINAIGFAEELIETLGGERWDNMNEEYSEKEVYHYSPGWDFKKEDDKYVKDSLAIGECPMCLSNRLEVLATGTTKCLACDSYYNVKNKSEEIWY